MNCSQLPVNNPGKQLSKKCTKGYHLEPFILRFLIIEHRDSFHFFKDFLRYLRQISISLRNEFNDNVTKLYLAFFVLYTRVEARVVGCVRKNVPKINYQILFMGKAILLFFVLCYLIWSLKNKKVHRAQRKAYPVNPLTVLN